MQRNWYELRIPPPVIDGLCAFVMWALARALPQAQLWPQGQLWATVAALVLAAIGGALALAVNRPTIAP